MSDPLRGVPVLGICGYSGAGKTTLVLELLPRLLARGWSVLVIKHDAHGLCLDREGKDSARLFAAGADVVAHDPAQSVMRRHLEPSVTLADLLRREAPRYDLILVEGHKQTPLADKLWLRRHARDAPPVECQRIRLDLGPRVDRVAVVDSFLRRWLAEVLRQRPLLGGVLIGGKSERMGSPKHLLHYRGRTWLDLIASALVPAVERVVLLGGGQVPRGSARLLRLPDAPTDTGPAAGMLAALRWCPFARWVFAASDTPFLSEPAVRWLIARSKPGAVAVQARMAVGQAPEPFPGVYAGRVAHLLEADPRPARLADYAQVESPLVPARLRASWQNVNTPLERHRARA